ncbi:hypothetical protein B0H13DRAFT_2267017, partial [Mycena leptocephala]
FCLSFHVIARPRFAGRLSPRYQPKRPSQFICHRTGLGLRAPTAPAQTPFKYTTRAEYEAGTGGELGHGHSTLIARKRGGSRCRARIRGAARRPARACDRFAATPPGAINLHSNAGRRPAFELIRWTICFLTPIGDGSSLGGKSRICFH